MYILYMTFICIYHPSLWTFYLFWRGPLSDCLCSRVPDGSREEGMLVCDLPGSDLSESMVSSCSGVLCCVIVGWFNGNQLMVDLLAHYKGLFPSRCIYCTWFLFVYTIHLFGLLPVLEGHPVWWFMRPSHTHSVTTESDSYPGRRRIKRPTAHDLNGIDAKK
jgi:hypothetical protein